MLLSSKSKLGDVVGYLSGLYYYGLGDKISTVTTSTTTTITTSNNNNNNINDALLKVWKLKFPSLLVGQLLGEVAVRHSSNPSFLINQLLQGIEGLVGGSSNDCNIMKLDSSSNISPSTIMTIVTIMSETEIADKHLKQQVRRLIISNLSDWGDELSQKIVKTLDFKDFSFDNAALLNISLNLETPSLQCLIAPLICAIPTDVLQQQQQKQQQQQHNLQSKLSLWITGSLKGGGRQITNNIAAIIIHSNHNRIRDSKGKKAFIQHYSTILDPPSLASLVVCLVGGPASSITKIEPLIPSTSDNVDDCYLSHFIAELYALLTLDDGVDYDDGFAPPPPPKGSCLEGYYFAHRLGSLKNSSIESIKNVLQLPFTIPNNQIITSFTRMDPITRLSLIGVLFSNLKLQITIMKTADKKLKTENCTISSVTYLLRHALEQQFRCNDCLTRIEQPFLKEIHSVLQSNPLLIPSLIEGLLWWDAVHSCSSLLDLLDCSTLVSMAVPPGIFEKYDLFPLIVQNWTLFRKSNLSSFSDSDFLKIPENILFQWVWLDDYSGGSGSNGDGSNISNGPNSNSSIGCGGNGKRNVANKSKSYHLPPLEKLFPSSAPPEAPFLRRYTTNQIKYLEHYYSLTELKTPESLVRHRDHIVSVYSKSLSKVLLAMLTRNPSLQPSLIDYFVDGIINHRSVHTFLEPLSVCSGGRMEFLGFFFSFTKLSNDFSVRSEAFSAILRLLKSRRTGVAVDAGLLRDLLQIVLLEVSSFPRPSLVLEEFLLFFLDEICIRGAASAAGGALANNGIDDSNDSNNTKNSNISNTKKLATTCKTTAIFNMLEGLIITKTPKTTLLECIHLILPITDHLPFVKERSSILIHQILTLPKNLLAVEHLDLVRILVAKQADQSNLPPPSIVVSFILRTQSEFPSFPSTEMLHAFLLQDAAVRKELWLRVADDLSLSNNLQQRALASFESSIKVTLKHRVEKDKSVHLGIMKASFQFSSLKGLPRMLHLSHLALLKNLTEFVDLKAQLTSTYSVLLKTLQAEGGGRGGCSFLLFLTLAQFHHCFPCQQRSSNILERLPISSKEFPTAAMLDYVSLTLLHSLSEWNSALILRIFSNSDLTLLCLDKITSLICSCYGGGGSGGKEFIISDLDSNLTDTNVSSIADLADISLGDSGDRVSALAEKGSYIRKANPTLVEKYIAALLKDDTSNVEKISHRMDALSLLDPCNVFSSVVLEKYLYRTAKITPTKMTTTTPPTATKIIIRSLKGLERSNKRLLAAMKSITRDCF